MSSKAILTLAALPLFAFVPLLAAAQQSGDTLSEAEAAISKSDWQAAATRLDAFLLKSPGDARALFDAAYVADAQNRLDDAAALYRRAIEANPRSFEARVSLGFLLARQGKSKEARTELATATTLDPGAAGKAAKARAWRALARLDRAENPQLASSDLIEALKLSPETPDDTALAAQLAEQSGQLDEAEATYRKLLAADAKSSAANAGLAHILLKKKQYPEAESLLRQALAATPDDLALNAQLATTLAAENKQEALPLLEKLHKANPSQAAITRMLAEVRSEAGDAAASDQLYRSLLQATPDDATLLVAHGQNLVRLAAFAEAYSTFNRATRLDPKSVDGWSGLAFAASRTTQPQEVLRALDERLKLTPEIPSTWFLRATALDALHNKKEAIAAYQKFVETAAGHFPDQEWQARQRLHLLGAK